MNKFLKFVLIGVNLILLFAAIAVASDQQPAADARVIFHVAWYDVGKAALEGLDGVKHVENGTRQSKLWFKETNTVTYDPQRITMDEMKTALQKAGTYKGILAPEE